MYLEEGWNLRVNRVTSVRATLERIGAIDSNHVRTFAHRTRDRDIPVLIDARSGVIFIDDFYVGDAEYMEGSYRDPDGCAGLENLVDTHRRVECLRNLYFGRRLIDFGCGYGTFLRKVNQEAKSAIGVELDAGLRASLIREGIPCHERIADVPGDIDIVTMFHVLEHLPDPLGLLGELRDRLVRTNGTLVVEVPSASDFLITELRCQPFIEFTLWSQHLVLHTRDSLKRLLGFAGFSDIQVFGVQRYGLSNHITWMTKGVPGGHRERLAVLETPELRLAYESALASNGLTDTLFAIARM